MKSEINGKITGLLAIILGFAGVHRFYVGKIGTGILMLISFGGLCIWWIIDVIIIVLDKFKDKKGQTIYCGWIDEFKRDVLGYETPEEKKERMKREEEERRRREAEEKKQQKEEEKRRKELIKEYGEEIAAKILNKQVFIDMTRYMLIEALGFPSDKKEKVTKNKTTKKYYYNPRENRQKNTVYGLEVTLTDDVVSGWKDL